MDSKNNTGAKGLVEVYTGDGKGKTTCAVGLAVRCAGQGFRVLFAQFLKGRSTGEIDPLKKLGVKVIRSESVTKFIPDMAPSELALCRHEQNKVFDAVRQDMDGYGLVVLDEIFGAVSTGMIDKNDVITLINQKPAGTELVLTGRGAPDEIIKLADYVSEIKAVKHPYEKGIAARRGIEY